MNKKLKSGVLELIKKDRRRPNDQQIGIDKIINAVKVSDYQKMRYFVFWLNFHLPVLNEVQYSKGGGINPIKIMPTAHSASEMWKPYMNKVRPETRFLMDKTMSLLLQQYHTYIALYGKKKEVKTLLEAYKKSRDQKELIRSNFGFHDDHQESTDHINNLIIALEKRLLHLQINDSQNIIQNEAERPPLNVKTFPEYLLLKEPVRLATLLKTEFNVEKGKGVRLMIDVLKDMGILTIENRKRKAIYEALKIYFDRDIGSYQGIFDYKRDKDKPDYESVKERIAFVLTNIKKEK
jgi:hypothetical protein